MAPQPNRKTSGRAADREKEKERKKEIKEIKENIKAYLSKENANGEQLDNLSANKECEPVTHDEESGNHDENTCDCNQDESIAPFKDPSENAGLNAKQTSVSTQTCEDEILKAIQELATKYQQVDDAINDPKVGLTYQLSKTQAKVTDIHTEIYGAVSGIKTQLNSLTESANANAQKIITMENSQKRMTALLEENKRLVQELQIMQGLVNKAVQKADQNSNQILDLTKRSMEQNLIIHGVDDSLEKSEDAILNPRERPKYSALDFFKKELKVDLAVEDIWKAHRTGRFQRDKVRPLVVKISYGAKELVMEHIAELKGKSNPITKQKYFISEQIPEGIMEMKKQTSARLKPIKEQNDKKPKEERSQIQILGDKILVDNKLVEPEVKTPTPSQLFVNPNEQKQIDQLQSKMIETPPEMMRNSEFLAMAVKVHSIQEVNQAYVAATQRYPAAEHVMLGYALKEEGKLKAGFCDDREFGAGQRIKNLIFETKTRNVAVFVLRKYGGVHLGFQRFTIIEKMAQRALTDFNESFS